MGWPDHLATPIHAHITRKNTEVRKFQALKRYVTQISLDMTLEIMSHAKGHSIGDEIFRGVNEFNGYKGAATKFFWGDRFVGTQTNLPPKFIFS